MHWLSKKSTQEKTNGSSPDASRRTADANNEKAPIAERIPPRQFEEEKKTILEDNEKDANDRPAKRVKAEHAVV